MLDYTHHTMLLPLSAASSSDALLNVDNHNKFPGSQIFLRQQHTVQIIQLVECDPPPPRRITAVINEQASSSSSYAYSSEYSSSSASDEADDDDDDDDDNDQGNAGEEDEEGACSSYCSSDLPPEHLSSPQCDDSSSPPPRQLDPYSETYAIRMKRILAWRENFSTHLTDTLSCAEPSLSSSLKRKMDLEDDDDTMSHTSKRSRSQASQADASVRTLGMHSCPACDAFFSTRRSLLQHGRDAKANEACSVAVEYAFE